MNSLSSLKVWMWSVVIVTGLTGLAFAQHGHGGGHGGGGHHGGGHHGGGHHGGGHHGGGHHGDGGHHGGGFFGGGHHGDGHHGGGFFGGYGGYNGSPFGFGGLGYGGYGYDGYPGYGFGGSPYGYGSGYYSTPSNYYSTPSYSYPRTVIVNSRPSAPAPTFDNGPIVITAPATNDKPLRYTLNGTGFTMKPGQSQKFRHDRDWLVEFDRGDGRGSAQYSLKATAYKFKKTNNGWELFEAAKPEPPRDSVPVAPVPMDDIK